MQAAITSKDIQVLEAELGLQIADLTLRAIAAEHQVAALEAKLSACAEAPAEEHEEKES